MASMLSKIEKVELIRITIGDKEIELTRAQYEELEELLHNYDGSDYYVYNSY